MGSTARFMFVWVCCGVGAAGVACSTGTPGVPSTAGRAVRGGATAAPIRIGGRTIDWHSGAGIGGITVELGGVRALSDATGLYTLTLGAGPYDPFVAGLSSGASHVWGPAYRGDFLVDAGTCVSRDGTVASARTGVPIAGATVSLGGAKTTTGADGWYRIDLGCPAGGGGFNPSSFSVAAPDYVDWSEPETRGVFSTVRIDL